MNCVSCYVPGMRLFVFFPGVFLSSRETGACPTTTDLLMRVNVRTATTTTTYICCLCSAGAFTLSKSDASSQ